MSGIGQHVEYAQNQVASFQAQSAKDLAHESLRKAPLYVFGAAPLPMPEHSAISADRSGMRYRSSCRE